MSHAPSWPRGPYSGYPAAGEAPAQRLYAARADAGGGPPVLFEATGPHHGGPLLRIDGATLHVAPFRIDRWGQRYLSRGEIAADLSTLASTLYRIVAVHNFRVEDRNPDLDECAAAIFLARQVGGRWEEAEEHPVECRSLAVLGRLDVAVRRILPP